MDLSPAFTGLSDKQRLYVQARLEGNAPAIAARIAGVKSPSSSWRVMENHRAVVAALEKGREISIKATGVTRQTVTEMLQEAFRNATTAMEQVAAARELGKLHGLYEAQKIQHELRVENARSERELRALPTQELEKLAALDVEFTDITPSKETAVARLEKTS